MVFINEAIKEITLKLVYYGPGLSGKTTNLEKIYENPKLGGKGKMITMSTETDRTIFFDFLPMEFNTGSGYKIRIQIYTVPGQVFYDATRRLVLKGADGVVFVVDSQKALLEANIDSFKNLMDNLVINKIDPEKIPIILQYNKRDLKEVMTVEELQGIFNPSNKYSFFEASAINGEGVLKTLQKAVHLMIENLNKKIDIGLAEKKEEKREERAEEKMEDFLTLLKMLYNSNKNIILLISSLLEDLKKQEEFLESYIEKAKEKKL